jgi:hypothetical protein
MAGELRAEHSESSRAISPALPKFEVQNLWTRDNIQALNRAEQSQIAQLPSMEFSSSTKAAGVIARDTVGPTSAKDRELVIHGVLPDGDNLLNSLKAAQGKDKVAQSIDIPSMPTLVPSPEQLGMTPETFTALARAAAELAKPWIKDRPLADRENEIMARTTGANPRAWDDAKAAFPQLNKVSTDIMQAYTRNEIANYNRFDLKDDLDAATGKVTSLPMRPADQATLGISQISPKGVREFEEKYPQFKKFLESKGYTGPGHEMAALLDPECAPMIIAAKTASIVEDMHNHGIRNPSPEQIAYAYNPDVYSYSHGHTGKDYKTLYQLDVKISAAFHHDQKKEYYANRPEIISTSSQVHNVMSRLKNAEIE